ncbi:BnaC02g16660D [Brassica napus]|uniref:BnaC02g16660D protein n=1 Tax=Brassica napus TaxID=3708 RepID=A0A078I1U5_BRANA|nr:BnaC02g16660D [Brassica napus]
MCDRGVNARVQKGEVAGDIIRHYVLTDPNPTASDLIRSRPIFLNRI